MDLAAIVVKNNFTAVTETDILECNNRQDSVYDSDTAIGYDASEPGVGYDASEPGVGYDASEPGIGYDASEPGPPKL